jgi:hypothetical protein
VIDPAKRADVIRDAEYAYRYASYPSPEFGAGSDTLIELAKALDRALELLRLPANSKRLMQSIIEDRGPVPLPLVGDFVILLERYQNLALATHRGRGKPSQKGDLSAAYRVLAASWCQQEGDRYFTNGWATTESGDLVPTSSAARFLFEALREIAPRRERLAEELRAMMADTVKRLPGARRGRRS